MYVVPHIHENRSPRLTYVGRFVLLLPVEYAQENKFGTFKFLYDAIPNDRKSTSCNQLLRFAFTFF